jgi:protein-S-isoprenylcysteine O-methyltransferase Ste14
MDAAADNSQALIRPPVALALAFLGGLCIDRFILPLPFLPGGWATGLVGLLLFLAGLALVIWALDTFRRAGTRVETHQPTTAIASDGPYRYSRNPIYAGMLVGLLGLSIGFNSLWILASLVPFYLVIRHGVVAREEAYLERKFGAEYLAYKGSVRRWL